MVSGAMGSSNAKSSASSLSLATMDSSRYSNYYSKSVSISKLEIKLNSFLIIRSTCSSSPSPINSPESVRRQLNGSQLQLQRIGGGAGGGGSGRRRKPGAIDNSHLISTAGPNLSRIPSITNEGGRLRRDLMEGRDFKILPKSLWNALQQWYGVGVALPRQVWCKFGEMEDLFILLVYL